MIFDELVKSASEFPVAVNAVRNPDVILKQFFKKKKTTTKYHASYRSYLISLWNTFYFTKSS